MASARPGHFPTTRWSLVLAARGDRAAHRRALEELLRDYWKPLYLFARYGGLAPTDAEDAVQGLFAKLLDKEFLAGLDPDKGRLRNYLKAAMRHYLRDLHDRAVAVKRGGAERPLDIDGATAERALARLAGDSPEVAYERSWAMQLLDNAFEKLRAEFADGKRGGPFELVERYFSLDELVAQDELAPRFGMTVPQLKSFLHRARGRFRALVEEEVAATVERAEDVDAELGYLRTLLSPR
jgi:RNA polymerase sigma-70 factor (ECF subfamily)